MGFESFPLESLALGSRGDPFPVVRPFLRPFRPSFGVLAALDRTLAAAPEEPFPDVLFAKALLDAESAAEALLAADALALATVIAAG